MPRPAITCHEAFDYYGDAYGIEFLAAQGVSGEDAEPSARDIAKLIQQIKKEKITGIFVENISSGRLMDRIAKETGAKIGGELYSDALSPPGGPARYLCRHDAFQHQRHHRRAAERGRLKGKLIYQVKKKQLTPHVLVNLATKKWPMPFASRS